MHVNNIIVTLYYIIALWCTSGITAASSVGFIPPDLRIPPPGLIGMRINLNRPPPTHGKKSLFSHIIIYGYGTEISCSK